MGMVAGCHGAGGKSVAALASQKLSLHKVTAPPVSPPDTFTRLRKPIGKTGATVWLPFVRRGEVV
jgi:hypothetical protein